MALFEGTIHGSTHRAHGVSPANTGTTIGSQLLPLLWERLESRSTLSILDLGIGTVQSLDFYSSRDARVYFADISQELSSDEKNTPLTADGFGGIDSFDVCFCWDFLNRMTTAQLRDFAADLIPRCNRDTYIHLFVAHTSVLPLPMRRYSIRSSSELIWRNPNSAPSIDRPRTHGELMRCFPKLKFSGARLIEQNRHELYGRILN